MKGQIEEKKNTPNYHPIIQSIILQMKVMAHNSYVDENPNNKPGWKEPMKIIEIIRWNLRKPNLQNKNMTLKKEKVYRRKKKSLNFILSRRKLYKYL